VGQAPQPARQPDARHGQATQRYATLPPSLPPSLFSILPLILPSLPPSLPPSFHSRIFASPPPSPLQATTSRSANSPPPDSVSAFPSLCLPPLLLYPPHSCLPPSLPLPFPRSPSHPYPLSLLSLLPPKMATIKRDTSNFSLPPSLDILPHIWIERFATLQDDVPPKPGHEIIKIVEK